MRALTAAQQHTETGNDHRLLHITHLIGELFSPQATEHERLRHVTAGDIIVFLHSRSLNHTVRQVLQVTGPIQHLRLGIAYGDEQYAIPVNDITGTTTSAVLVVNGREPFMLISLDTDSDHRRRWDSGSAVDRWSILPSHNAHLPHPTLAERAIIASRRASNAFQ